MFNPLACLILPLQRQNEEKEKEEKAHSSPSSMTASTTPPPPPPPPPPRRRRRRRSWSWSWSWNSSAVKNVCCNKRNPYSTLGLDKYSTLLKDLEERRLNIYEQRRRRRRATSQPQDQDQDQDLLDVPNYVRFVYSDSGDWVPIFFNFRDPNYNHNHNHNPKQAHKQKHDKAAVVEKALGSGGNGGQQDHKSQKKSMSVQNPPTIEPQPPINNYPPPPPPPPPSKCITPINNNNNNNNGSSKASSLKPIVQFSSSSSSDVIIRKKAQKKNSQINSHQRHRIQKLDRWRRGRPSQYLPLVVVLSLVCLVMLGRSFAILLTSALWYLIPNMIIPTQSDHQYPPPLLRSMKTTFTHFMKGLMRSRTSPARHHNELNDDSSSPATTN